MRNTQANDNKPIKPQPIKYENLPTKERLAKDEFEIYDSGRGRTVATARAKHVWLIDRLKLSPGKDKKGEEIPPLITPSQHSSAVLLRQLHHLQKYGSNPTGMRFDGMPQLDGSIQNLMVDIITAKDKYLYVMKLISGCNLAYWQLISDVCFDDLSTTYSCRKIGIGRADNNKLFVRTVFALLDESMEQMHYHWNRVAKSLYKINN